MTRKSVATQPIPSPVVKHFRQTRPPYARCANCDWSQSEASLAECRIHVRYHPSHLVTRTAFETVSVWAQDRDGNPLTEDRHV